MEAPRKPNIILEELRELDAIISEGNVLEHQFPEDNFLKISQTQTRNQKAKIQDELFESQKYYGQQSFILAFEESPAGIDAHLLPNLIKAVTDIFDQTQKLLTNERKNSVPMLFTGVVQSSFGFHFSIDKGQNLFGNDYDDLLTIIFETINDLNQSNSIDEIKGIINHRFEGHKPILKSYRSFFQSVNKSELPLKVFWRSPSAKDFEFKMNPEKTEMLYKEFKKSLSTIEVTREYRGEIQGLSQWEKKIEFLATQGSDDLRIVAHFDETDTVLSEQIQVFNKPRLAIFRIRESINDLTDETKTEYFLIDLKRI